MSGGGDEPFTGRTAIGYDHGYDGEGFIEGCLERIGEDNPDEERLFRDL